MSPMRLLFGCACLSAVLVLARVATGQEEKSVAGPQDVLVNPAAQKQYDDKAVKLAETDVKGWLGLADFCEAQLLFSKREAALRKAVAASADNPDAHRRLDEVKVGKEWLAVTEAESREAKDHEGKGEVFYGKAWMPAKSADHPRAADKGAAGWDVQTRVDGKYCIVFSATTYLEAKAVAATVDSVVAEYAASFGKVRKLDLAKPIVVHLFAAQDTFAVQFKRLAKTGQDIPKGFAGGYNQNIKGLAVSTDIGMAGWNSETLLHSVAHETTHALDDMAAGMQMNSLPTWVPEGRAIYAQYALVGRQMLPGAVNIGGTDGRGQEGEKAYPTASISRLLSLDHKTFMTAAPANYAVAWSFTHFLMHGDNGKYRDRYLKFLAGCPKACSAADFEKTVAKASELEPLYRTYVETIFLPAVKASVNADRKAKGMAGDWK